MLHTSKSINICRQCQLSAPAGDTCSLSSDTLTVFLSPHSSYTARGACVCVCLLFLFFIHDSGDRLCMGATMCDTNDKSLSECVTCTTPPPQSLSSVYLSAGVSVSRNASTGTICCHTSSHLQPQGSISVHSFDMKMCLLAVGHSCHTQLNEPFNTQGVADFGLRLELNS